ncbi:hypothetical protein PR003_g14928 [Phytophthora rubi]|uniref:HTH CENPB-type domain-containing protein n=1 Tax=Phytophthora rubi TaxID=129364 RepID=A0A6A4F1A1_9STRA|nr:hypothetical protein PR001_g23529 [Phytophthora rubi]KAE9331601.1 hypothetical protein PR003_g14928 [Phytophthora rubi]
MARQRPGRKRGENDKGKHHHVFKRSTEPYFVNLAALNHYRDHKSMDDTLAKFFPNAAGNLRETKRKSIYLWESQRAKIEAACETTKGGQLKSIRDLRTATMLSSDGEREIFKWIDNLRAEGAPVSAFMLRRKAIEITAAERLFKDVFKASWTSRKGILRRHMLSLRRHTRQGQKPPADCDAAEFRVKVRELMKEHAVDRVYNADQTAVFFECLSKQTISGREKKPVWVRCAGKKKERVTVMLLGDSCGTRYTPFVIAKAKKSEKEDTAVENKAIRHGFGIGVWKEVIGLQNRLDVIMYRNPKGWWNGELSLEFLRFHFASRPNQDQLLKSHPQPVAQLSRRLPLTPGRVHPR